MEEKKDTKLFNIVLIGSPNVGKSSVFNFLVKKKEAIVRDEEGTTIDFRSKRFENFILWDSPGSYDLIDVPFEPDQVVFIVENNITDNDKKRYLLLKSKYQDKLIVLINKIDLGEDNYSFFEHYLKISIKERIGLTALENIFNFNLSFKNDKKIWAILGRPNVGKSSLANLLYRKKINKVEDKEGTTKEFLPIEIDNNIILDTPGQRKKALFPLYANVFGLIIMLDTDFQKQDLRLVDLAQTRNKPVIVLLNKTDVKFNKNICLFIKKYFNVDLVNFSCKNRKGLNELRQKIKFIETMFFERIPTAKLNSWLQQEIKPRIPRLKFISQISCAPHTFYLDHPLTKEKERMFINKLKNFFGLNNFPILLKYPKENED